MVRPQRLAKIRDYMWLKKVMQPYIKVNIPLSSLQIMLLVPVVAITAIALDRKFGR